MDVYSVIGILPAFLSFFLTIFFKKNTEIKRKYLYIIMFSVFAFLFAFRAASVGTDTQYYINRYLTIYNYGITRFNQIYSSEIGFTLYNLMLTKIFGANYQWLFIISGIFIMFSFGRFLYKHAKADVLTLMLFALAMFPRSLNILRTEIAVAICLFGIEYAQQGSLAKAVTVCILGATFHLSVLLFIPVIFILNSKSSLRYPEKIALIVGLIIFLYVGWRTLITFVPLFSKYRVYDGAQASYNYRITAYSIYVFYGLYLVFSVFIYFYFKKHADEMTPLIFESKYGQLWGDFQLESILYLVFVLGTIVSQFNWILSRITDVFFIGYILYIPFATKVLFSKIVKPNLSSLAVIIVFVLLFGVSINAVHANIAGCYPYEFVRIDEVFK